MLQTALNGDQYVYKHKILFAPWSLAQKMDGRNWD